MDVFQYACHEFESKGNGAFVKELLKRYLLDFKERNGYEFPVFDEENIHAVDICRATLSCNCTASEQRLGFGLRTCCINIPDIQCGVVLARMGGRNSSDHPFEIYQGNALKYSHACEASAAGTRCEEYWVCFPATWDYIFCCNCFADDGDARLYVVPGSRDCNNHVDAWVATAGVSKPISDHFCREKDHGLIAEFHGNLSPGECDMFIELFGNAEVRHYEGLTGAGLNKRVKNTTDYRLPNDSPFFSLLFQRLSGALQIFVENRKFPLAAMLRKYAASIPTIQLQKYVKEQGKFTPHIDNTCSKRIIAFMWYLNTMEEGGDTAFHMGTPFEKRLKPRKGTLVLFPTNCTFYHCGKIPLTTDKYILTGWVYLRDDPSHSGVVTCETTCV